MFAQQLVNPFIQKKAPKTKKIKKITKPCAPPIRVPPSKHVPDELFQGLRPARIDNIPWLTVKQPWASALVHGDGTDYMGIQLPSCGGKDVENRSTPRKYKGFVLIKASGEKVPLATLIKQEFDTPDIKRYVLEMHAKAPTGVAVGLVYMNGSIPLEDTCTPWGTGPNCYQIISTMMFPIQTDEDVRLLTQKGFLSLGLPSDPACGKDMQKYYQTCTSPVLIRQS